MAKCTGNNPQNKKARAGRGGHRHRKEVDSRVLRDERGWPEDINFLAGRCEMS